MAKKLKTVNNILDNLGLKGMDIFGMGMGAVFGYMDYKQARDEGKTVVGAAASAVGTNIMMDVIGWPAMLALGFATAVPKVAVQGYEGLSKMARSMSSMGRNVPFQNAQFFDNQQVYTMRQAGMKVAQASKYNLQQTMLGNEAQYMHL